MAKKPDVRGEAVKALVALGMAGTLVAFLAAVLPEAVVVGILTALLIWAACK